MAGTEERSTYWSPSRNYELSCKVGSFDLTNDLEQLYIIKSVETPYESVVLDFFADAGDMILEKIYGQRPMKLIIKTFGTSENIPHETLTINLMALGSKYDLILKDTDPQIPDKTRSAIRIKAVPIEGYNAMTTLVKGVYLESSLSAIISDLNGQVDSADILSSNSDTNTETLDQVIVPPSTLYNTLKYLDRTFGFFHGLAAISSNSIQSGRGKGKKSSSVIDNNFKSEVHITNLSQISGFAPIVITQLSATADQEDLLNRFDGKNFYTYNPIETEYIGNTAYSTYGSTMRHVVKPRDELFHTIEIDTTDFINNYGIITKKNSAPFNAPAQLDRTGFFKDHTGYDRSPTHIEAGYSKMFSQMSLLKIHLEKWLLLENLLKIGYGVTFKSNIQDNRDLTGNYVVKVSQAHFIRATRDWECGVTLHLIRSNRII